MVALLEAAVQTPSRMPELISAFQQAAWKGELATGAGEEILRDLAYDLDFYEPNPVARAEDRSFLNEDQAIAEIEAALTRLREIGAL